MKNYIVKVKSFQGIHARIAVSLSNICRESDSSILLKKEEKVIDCNEVVSIMNLGVKQGDIVKFYINGCDEEDVLSRVKEFCNKCL